MALAWCEINLAWREIRPPGRSAPCPPPCGLLLDLRRTPRRPDLGHLVFPLEGQRQFFAAAGLGCLSQRSQGGGPGLQPWTGGHERRRIPQVCCGHRRDFGAQSIAPTHYHNEFQYSLTE